MFVKVIYPGPPRKHTLYECESVSTHWGEAPAKEDDRKLLYVELGRGREANDLIKRETLILTKDHSMYIMNDQGKTVDSVVL